MSTLERGNEIEDDFYHLKAQEWAVEPHEAKRMIEAAMKDLSKICQLRREIEKQALNPNWHEPGSFPG